MEGKIVAVGPASVAMTAKTVIECRVKVGDKVLFGKYTGTEVKLDGEEYVIMREEDLFAVID